MKSKREIKKIAQKCISIEVNEAKNLINKIDDNFVDVVNVLYQTRGRVIITAIGKSANISNKIVATLNSTGTPAIFVHAAEALHGDLGVINSEDIFRKPLYCYDFKGLCSSSIRLECISKINKTSGYIFIIPNKDKCASIIDKYLWY